jgi:hypothetical protein
MARWLRRFKIRSKAYTLRVPSSLPLWTMMAKSKSAVLSFTMINEKWGVCSC